MKNKIKIAVLSALCLLALSCGNNDGKSGKVIFESEDKKIKVYENEVNNELAKDLFSNGLTEKDLTPEQLTQMKHSVIKSIALNRALALKGKDKKLDKDKKYTQSSKILQEQLLAQLALISDVNEKVKITDAEAKAAYDANPATFTRQEDSIRIQLIQFPTSEAAKANEALKEVLANPANFTAYVQKYNPNVPGGTGETQEIPLSQLEKGYGPISEAVKSLQSGQVANSVITVGNELYIVKVLAKNPKGLVPFESVKETIKTQLRNQKRQAEQQNYIKSVSDDFKLSNMEQALKNVK